MWTSWESNPNLDPAEVSCSHYTTSPSLWEYIAVMSHSCQWCQSEFFPSQRELNRGNGKFCSRSCGIRHTHECNRKTRLPNTLCAYCTTPFWASQRRQNLSKSGLLFCGRSCKNLAQRLEGIPEMHPEHYGSGVSYRKIGLRNCGQICSGCGFSSVPEILQVHHRDKNRKNYSLENLVVLCPNCHAIEHFKEKTGFWRLKHPTQSGSDRS